MTIRLQYRACIGLGSAGLAMIMLGLAPPASIADAKNTKLPGQVVYDGHLTVTYNPVMCVKSPCSAGTYTIEGRGSAHSSMACIKAPCPDTVSRTFDQKYELIGKTEAVVVEDVSVLPERTTTYTGSYLPDTASNFDGEVSFSADGKTAFIHAFHIAEGEWKP